MSHWSKGKVKVKDLATLDMVAKKAGLKVRKAEKGSTLTMRSNYAGTMDCERIYSHKSGEAAVVKETDGSYSMIMDNWGNPIVQKIGSNGAVLMRDYSVEVVHNEAMRMGGVIASQTMLADGSVEVEIQI